MSPRQNYFVFGLTGLLLTGFVPPSFAELPKQQLLKTNPSVEVIPRLRDLQSPLTHTSGLRKANKPLLGRGNLAQLPTGIVRVTGVQLVPSAAGLEVRLRTADGKPLPAVAQTQSGNTLTVAIPNAVLALPDREAFAAENPTSGIASVSVTQLEGNNVQVALEGQAAAPTAAVIGQKAGLVLSAVAPLTLEEVVVTGERQAGSTYNPPNVTTATRTDTPLRDIPQSIQVVPKQVIEDQRANRLEDVVRNVSGVSVGDSFGNTIDRFNIRGFAQETVLKDGFRQNSFGQGIVNIDQLERVEVLKGPASVLYGNLEPGGVINLVTKKPLRDPYYATDLEIGSYGYLKTDLDFSGPFDRNEQLLYRLNASYEAEDGWRDFERDVSRRAIAPRIRWQIAKSTSLSVNFGYLNEERPFDRGLVAIGDEVADIPYDRIFQDPDAEATIEQYDVNYQLEHQFGDRWQIRNSGRILSSDTFDFKLDSDFSQDSGILDRSWASNSDLIENYSLQTNIDGKFSTSFLKHQILFGIDLDRATSVGSQRRLPGEPNFPTNIFSSQETSVSRPDLSELTLFSRDESRRSDLLGIYLQDQIDLFKDLKVLIGGRFDLFEQNSIDFTTDTSTSQSGNRFSPRVGIVYQPSQQISLFTSYSQSFNPDEFSIDANNSFLEPSIGEQFEVGIKGDFLDGKLSSTLAAFQINKSNVATSDPDNPDFSIAVGEVRSRGIELDVTGEIVPGWNVVAAYALTDAEITEDNFYSVGNQLSNVPENSVSLWTSYEIQKGNLKGLGLSTGAFFVGDRQGDLDNSFTLPSYFRADAGLFYRRMNWQANLNFQNLFDASYIRSSENYREAIRPGDPFTVIGSISIKF